MDCCKYCRSDEWSAEYASTEELRLFSVDRCLNRGSIVARDSKRFDTKHTGTASVFFSLD